MKDKFEFEKQKWEDAKKAEAEASASGGGSKKERKPFYGFQFKMWNDNSVTINKTQQGTSNKEWTLGVKGFEEKDREIISINKLTGPVKVRLAQELEGTWINCTSLRLE